MNRTMRDSWRWTPEQNIALVRRRLVERRPFKQIAHEFGRSEPTVQKQFHRLESLLESSHADILQRHREEELELLDKLLREQRIPDCGEHE